MGETTRFAKFISNKIVKIRWRPSTNQLVYDLTQFATGSWDNDVNKLSIWKLEDRTDVENNDSKSSTQIDVEPILLSEAKYEGDVTDLLYLPNDLLLSASSNGSVLLYKHDKKSNTLSIAQEWPQLHQYNNKIGCPCTSLTMKLTDNFASVGEDGRLCFVNVEKRQPLRVIENADSCTINGACYLKQTEVATVNSIGQLKIWDIRESSDKPSRIFLPTGERSSLQCVDKHPTQQHIVCTGGQDGALTIWDMRQDRFPVTVLQAHSADMWEVKFHPTHPDHLFTCSEDGSIWHWDASNMATGTTLSSKDFSLLTNPTTVTAESMDTSCANSPWLASEASKHRMDITDLLPGNSMPVNTFDILENHLLCGTDGEQIYTVVNLTIR